MLRKFNEPRNNKKTWKINIIPFSSTYTKYKKEIKFKFKSTNTRYFLWELNLIVIGQTISAKFFVQTIYLEL